MKICDDLRQAVLQAAIQGKLTTQRPEDGDARELLKQIAAEKAQLIKEKKIKKEKFNPIEPLVDDLPDTWVEVYIADIAGVTKLAGFEYTKYFKKESISSTNEVPIVRAQNVRMGKFIVNELEKITMKLSLELPRSALVNKCLLMTFIGAGIGDVCVFKEENRFHLAPNVAKIEPWSKNLDLDYLMICLMSPKCQKCVEDIKKSTAQPSLSMETIRNIKMNIPPLAEQHRIVAKVEKLMAEIDEL